MRAISFLVFILIVIPLSAQFSTLPLNEATTQWYENDLLRQEHQLHTAIRPWRRADVAPYSRRNELLPDSLASTEAVSWLRRKMFREHFFNFSGDGYRLTIDPVLGLVYGQESESEKYETIYQNSRGVRLEGSLGKNFSFYSTLVENQARFAAHVNELSDRQEVVPGYWLTKTFRDNAYDFAYAAGEIAYDAGKFFHFRLGRGKQFLGEGYRSMLLSNNSVNYPFFRIETTVGRIKYVNLWSVMNDIRPEVALADDVYAKKYLSMHYLSINIGRWLNVGLFEGLMWGDELNRYGFDANFLNPVILYRPVEFSQGFTGGNILMGLNASYQLPGGLKAYGQLAVDEFLFSEIRDWSNGSWLNMMAWQLGVKWGDALGIPNLFLRAEYNAARPHTYAHREALTNWGHYAQPLAHPLGANFSELLLHARYRYGRWQGQLAIHMAALGHDENAEANWGGDIYKPFNQRSATTGVFIGNGVPSDLLYWRAELNYIFNPLYNARVQLGVQSRSEDVPELGLPNSQTWYFGVKTDMYDLYQDY